MGEMDGRDAGRFRPGGALDPGIPRGGEDAEPAETAKAEADADEADANAKPTGAVETAESAAPPDVTADAEPAGTDS